MTSDGSKGLITVERQGDEVVYRWPLDIPWLRFAVASCLVLTIPLVIVDILHMLRFRSGGYLRLGPRGLSAVSQVGSQGRYAAVQAAIEDVGEIRIERANRDDPEFPEENPPAFLTVDAGGTPLVIGAPIMAGRRLQSPEMEWLHGELLAWKEAAQRGIVPADPETRRGKPPPGSVITVEREGADVVYSWPQGGTPLILILFVAIWIVSLPIAIAMLVDNIRYPRATIRLGPRGLTLGQRRKNYHRVVELARDETRKFELDRPHRGTRLPGVELRIVGRERSLLVRGLGRRDLEWLLEELKAWKASTPR